MLGRSHSWADTLTWNSSSRCKSPSEIIQHLWRPFADAVSQGLLLACVCRCCHLAGPAVRSQAYQEDDETAFVPQGSRHLMGQMIRSRDRVVLKGLSFVGFGWWKCIAGRFRASERFVAFRQGPYTGLVCYPRRRLQVKSESMVLSRCYRDVHDVVYKSPSYQVATSHFPTLLNPPP